MVGGDHDGGTSLRRRWSVEVGGGGCDGGVLLVVMGRDETVVAVCRGRDGVGRSETVGEDGWSERAKK